MLNEIIYPALIRLARAFPPGFNSRPNSFGAVLSFKDIDAENLNASMNDGRIGRYWGRRWEASGKDSNLLQFENSLVFTRNEAIFFKKASKTTNEVCQRLEIGVASLPECEGCAQARNDAQIEIDNALVLNQIVSELQGISPYLVTIPENLGGVGSSTYWLMLSEVVWLTAQGVSFPNLGRCDAYLSVKKTTDEFRSFDYGTAGMIITTAKMEVCWCDSTSVEYDFTINSFKQAAYTGCSTC